MSHFSDHAVGLPPGIAGTSPAGQPGSEQLYNGTALTTNHTGMLYTCTCMYMEYMCIALQLQCTCIYIRSMKEGQPNNPETRHIHVCMDHMG